MDNKNRKNDVLSRFIFKEKEATADNFMKSSDLSCIFAEYRMRLGNL